ncbi:ribonuclease [Corynebacterium sp. 320]|uniref:ribonuclease domain-containing protein n=1 Tax=Corynebacterium TaxID=1716 RepID=UPI00125CCFA9|nr:MULTISPECIES: ribonuclease domain-containing protein [Corynebacterium]KAB1502428.1 ribonuclease [Corynebacterium sp. 320]KAB1551351.1 ribonuclease [Corynebacterium sp. 321]KAB1551820.1 ribonuclease [Corynebacterium sp. 319]KAB3526035.1 ribonuclease [Corynebacterium sp. 250]KAB3538815.1 ribonuclease [Corynebacterium sp. 366]
MSQPRSTNKGMWAGGSVAAVLLAGATAYLGLSDSPSDTNSATSSVSESSQHCSLHSLPPEAAQQVEDILVDAPPDDGPADGKHFGNYEGLLPKQHSSYYREYTVKTPGLNHRGERRLVVGGGTKTDPDVWYYTDDHFKSFCEIPDAED